MPFRDPEMPSHDAEKPLRRPRALIACRRSGFLQGK